MKRVVGKLKGAEFKNARVRQLDDRIILIEFKNDFLIELEDVVEINKECYSLSGGQPFLSLMDIRVDGMMTAEARQLLAKDPLISNLRMAEAFVINNLVTRIFAKFYMKINRPDNPVEVFSHSDEAINWLHQQYGLRFKEVY